MKATSSHPAKPEEVVELAKSIKNYHQDILEGADWSSQ